MLSPSVLHPLDVLCPQSRPASEKTNQGSETESSRYDGEHSLQASDVSLSNNRNLLRSDGSADLSSAGRQRKSRVELGQVLSEMLDELVVEPALSGRDEEGAADGEADWTWLLSAFLFSLS
jgi:hypothetical protein